MADKLKITLAVFFVLAGVVGFYLLGEQPMVLRILSILAGIGAALTVAYFTEPGHRLLNFTRESIQEARNVVWPSRKETIQTTGIVFAFVIIMAIFLFLTDKSLEWVLYDLILGWKKS